MSAIVNVQGTDMPVLEINGRRVVTLAMVDKVHGRPEDTAGRNFRSNRQRFVEGEDFFVVSSDEIRRNNASAIPHSLRRNDIIVLTENGYLMLVKPFTDDLAWEVQRRLVNGYFRPIAATTVDQAKLNAAISLGECYVRLLRPAASSQVAMLVKIAQDHGVNPSFLPSYAVDEASDSTDGSSMATKTLTALLRDNKIRTAPGIYNSLLESAGMITQMSRKSRSAPGGIKHFWSITEAGLRFGKNITSPRNPRETQPHWYVARFAELDELVQTRRNEMMGEAA